MKNRVVRTTFCGAFSALALFVCAGLLGCAHFPAQASSDQAEALIAQIQASGPDRGDFKAIGRFRLVGPQATQSGRMAWLCAPPERFRLEVLSPFGQPLATLSSDGSKFYAYLRTEDQFVVSRPSPRVFKKILGVSLSARELVLILSGGMPILEHKAAQITQGDDGLAGQLLVLYDTWGRVRQKIWLAADGRAMSRCAVFDGANTPEYEMFFEPGTDGAPGLVRVMTAKGDVLEISPQQYWDHEKVQDAQFVLARPERVPEEP